MVRYMCKDWLGTCVRIRPILCHVFILGIFSGALANRFGCRIVTIIGGVLSCLAFVLSTFAPNMDIIILTYGFLGGTLQLYVPNIKAKIINFLSIQKQ